MFKKPQTKMEWAIAAGATVIALAVIKNVVGIFIPSQQVQDINQSTDELRKDLNRLK